MTTTSKRGGARKGAGRKPALGVAMEQYKVSLTPDQAARARAIGQGNLAAGVRALIDRGAPPRR